MKLKKNQTSIHYARSLLKQAEAIGLDADAIKKRYSIQNLAKLGFNDAIDNQLLTALVKHMWEVSGDETLGFSLEGMKPGTAALAFEHMLDAKNLGGLLKRGKRIWSYLPPADIHYDFQVGESFVTLDIGPELAKDSNHFMTEFLLALHHRFASWAIGEHIPLRRTYFTYEEPDHSWLYKKLFHSESLFSQTYNGFEFSTKYLSKPIARSRRELELWLKDSPADIMFIEDNDPSMKSRVKTALRNRLILDEQVPAFEDICDSLNLTPQSVRRRLAADGSSYQMEKNTVRHHLAIELLKNQHISMIDIAMRTGFSDATAFSRAFKKWTGMNPGAYRDQL